jgi:hypothetical protein
LANSSLSDDSTIYSYKLIRKIRHSYAAVTIYWTMLALFAFVQSLRGGGLWLLASAPAAFSLQGVISGLCLWMMRGGAASVWGWRFGALWNGLLPEGYAPLPLVRRIQSHSFWIGLAAVGLLVPWLPDMALESLFFFHLWLLAPRWMILVRIRRKTQAGWIKINPHDTSFYAQ